MSGCCSKSEKEKLSKRALILSYFTVAYNILEGVASIVAGGLANSISLIGFGLDSFVESLSGGIMIWRFSVHNGIFEKEEKEIEAKATKLVGYTFIILALYVIFKSFKKLYFKEISQPTTLGIVIAFVSLIVMPLLFYAKQKTAQSIGSTSLKADSKQTLACTFLSAVLLLGLLMNKLLGIWFIDPMIGFVIGVFLIKEGFTALKEGKLCSC